MFHRANRHALLLLVLLGAGSAWAQASGPERTFNLSRTLPDSLLARETEIITELSEPAIRPGQIETSLTLGFLNLDHILLSHPQVIYKYTEEARFWGDVAIVGQSAFNPVLRISYILTPWFAVEPTFSLSVSEYTSSITNRHRQSNEPDSEPDPVEPSLREFDTEQRSVISMGAGLNGMVYPLNIGGEGKGRWHPFLLGGAGRSWFDLNSNYTDKESASWEASFGGGLRFIADDLISVRFEMVYHSTTIQFSPAETFDLLDEGTKPIFIWEYPATAEGGFIERRVQEFAAQTLNTLTWGIGFTATF